ncbi:hypothetical protein [Legionella cincinnatiensis]|uniref:Uncharacterized protein n=1 Tax=Legionella cincinnatiensis TaxID=28085 RepID=A0A378ILC6_9GAMM|nr:hypothetical protein [Legionella cincinnatiensis]KTC88575.1 hypothetical protein Lcin_1452 [Legionella cincinnatiensis]STX35936.1 Uncharacterised protein [Legionella cincinnatiensis]
MSYGNFKAKIRSSHINTSDVIIRHIMCKDFDHNSKTVKTSAFDTAKLLGNGLSVSIERLLDKQTRTSVIRSLEKNKFKFICDYKSKSIAIQNIYDDNMIQAFELNYSPLIDNLAHAEIKFSITLASLTPAHHKKYRKLLMDKFTI